MDNKKKKKGTIKTWLEEFGSGSHLNQHQVSEAEGSGHTARCSRRLKPVGNVIFGVVGWINSALTQRVRRRRDLSTQRCSGLVRSQQ